MSMTELSCKNCPHCGAVIDVLVPLLTPSPLSSPLFLPPFPPSSSLPQFLVPDPPSPLDRAMGDPLKCQASRLLLATLLNLVVSTCDILNLYQAPQESL